MGERQGYDMADIPWARVKGGAGAAQIGLQAEGSASRGDYIEGRRKDFSSGTSAAASGGRGRSGSKGAQLRRRLVADTGTSDVQGESRDPALRSANVQRPDVGGDPDARLPDNLRRGDGERESPVSGDEDEGGNRGDIQPPESDGAADGNDARLLWVGAGEQDSWPESSALSEASESLHVSASTDRFKAPEGLEGPFLAGLVSSSAQEGRGVEGVFRGGMGRKGEGEGGAIEGPFPPWVTGSDADNYPLTRRVQRDVWVHQHPADCNHSSVR